MALTQKQIEEYEKRYNTSMQAREAVISQKKLPEYINRLAEQAYQESSTPDVELQYDNIQSNPTYYLDKINLAKLNRSKTNISADAYKSKLRTTPKITENPSYNFSGNLFGTPEQIDYLSEENIENAAQAGNAYLDAFRQRQSQISDNEHVAYIQNILNADYNYFNENNAYNATDEVKQAIRQTEQNNREYNTIANEYGDEYAQSLGLSYVDTNSLTRADNYADDPILFYQTAANVLSNLTNEEIELIDNYIEQTYASNISAYTLRRKESQAYQALADMGYNDRQIQDIAAMRRYQQDAIRRQAAYEATAEAVGDDAVRNVSASVISVPLRLIGAVPSLIGQYTNIDNYKYPVNTNASYYFLTNVSTDIRSEVSNNIVESIDNEKLGNAAAFLYNVGMSGLDSLAASFIPGGEALLGANAAIDTTIDIAQRGGTSKDAFVGGLIAGVFESAFEHLSLSQLRSFKTVDVHTMQDALKNIAKTTFTNFSEELLTEAANVAYDTLANGEASNYSIKLKEYMSEGLSEAEARAAVSHDLAIQVFEAGLSGAIMGAAFGSTGSILNYNSYSYNISQTLLDKTKDMTAEQKVAFYTQAVNSELYNQESRIYQKKVQKLLDESKTQLTWENQAKTTSVNLSASDTYTNSKIKSIKEYLSSVNSKLVDFAKKYINNPNEKFARFNISKVSQKQADDINNLLGGDYQGYTNAINSSAIKHIQKRHGNGGEADSSMKHIEDIGRIGYVLDNYDSIEVLRDKKGNIEYSKEFRDENNKPSVLLKYTKAVNGSFYVVEAVADNEYKKLWVQSAYINNSGRVTQVPNAFAPRFTSKTELPSPLADNNSIQDDKNNVKRDESGNRVTQAPDVQASGSNVRNAPASPLTAENSIQDKKDSVNETYGYSTRIKTPYEGKTPKNSDTAQFRSVSISENAVKSANEAIIKAQTEAHEGQGGFKSLLKQKIRQLFSQNVDSIDVKIENTTFEGQDYYVRLYKSVIGKLISDPNYSAEKIAVLDNISDVIKNAEYVGSGEVQADGGKKNRVERYDYFETIAEIPSLNDNGSYEYNNYVVSFDIEVEAALNRFRTYRIKNIELQPIEGLTGSRTRGALIDNEAQLNNNIHGSTENVNTFTQNNKNSISEEQRAEENEKINHEVIAPLDNKAMRLLMQKDNADTKTDRSLEQTAQDLEDMLNRKLVDAGYTLDAATRNSDRRAYYEYHNAKSVNAKILNAVGTSYIKKGKVVFEGFLSNVKGNKIAPSITELLYPFKQNEELWKDATEYFGHLNNISAITNLGENRIPYTLEESRQFVQDFEAKFPKESEGLKQAVKTVTDISQSVAVQSGIRSQQLADKYSSIYPNYAPMYRTADKNKFDSQNVNIFDFDVNKRALGSDKPFIPLDEALIKQYAYISTQASRNIFENAVLSEMQNNEELQKHVQILNVIDNTENKSPRSLKGKYASSPNVYVAVNGKSAVVFKISQNLNDAFKDLSNPTYEIEKYLGWWRSLNAGWRGLVTVKNPAFLIRNALKDVQDAFFNSSSAKDFIRAYPQALSELKGRGRYYQDFIADGVMGGSFFGSQEGGVSIDSKKQGIVGSIESANESIEMLPRLAEYIAVRKRLGDSYEARLSAAYHAKEVTTNFSRHGIITAILNRNGFNFLNPSIQGASKVVRNFTEADAKGKVILVLKAAMLGIGPKLLGALLYSDDDDYENLSDGMQANYYHIKIGDKFIRIPVGRTMAAIRTLSIGVTETLKGNDVNWGELIDNVASNIGPANPLTSNLFYPLYSVANNKTWYGGNIVNQSLSSKPASEQYDETTDELSKFLGKIFNYSPKKINYLLDQYTGVIGDFALPLITAESAGGNAVDYVISPLANAFMTDPVSSNDISDRYYALVDEINTDLASSSPTDGYELIDKYLNAQSRTISDLWNELHFVQSDTSLTLRERKDKVREIRKVINGIMLNAINNYDALIQAAPDYSGMTDDISTDYLYMNRDLFGAEYALKTYGSSVYDNAVQANAMGIDYEDYFDYYVLTKDIDAKDENGNTVTGLKKIRIYETINNMDLTTAQKAYLFATQYNLNPNDGYYDYYLYADSLRQYINTLPLSKDEKLMILEQFNCFEIDGYTVRIK